jgi:hypothetical protein
MKPAQAIRLAGSQARLHAIFWRAGYFITKQAISLWAVKGEIPPKRQLQLRQMRPWWFKRRANGMVKNPKPKQPPANLASAPGIRKIRRGGRKGKPATQGPPFRPKTYGDPETQI